VPENHSGEVRDTKLVVFFCRLVEEDKKKNHHFSREFDIKLRVTLVGGNALSSLFYAWNPNKW
jgi:hypothetical protein